jgi:glucose/mannose-6-phosphate isomerase
MEAERMLEEFPSQFLWEDISLDLGGLRTVTFCGMGGSGIVGDIARVWLEKKGFTAPTVSYRGYDLPPYVVGEDDLVICTSYSGNTEETISNFEEALRRGARAVAISSGGKLKEMAQREGVPWYPIPSGLAPRYALGFMLSKLLSILGCEKDEIEDLRETLENSREDLKKEGRELAKRLKGYTPIVYCTPLTEPAGFRYKTQFNENSKTQCYYAVLSEMHHNEVVGLENPLLRSRFFFILLSDPKDHERILLRVKITSDLLKEYGIVPYMVEGVGNSYLSRLVRIIYLGDWSSFFLAREYGFDPLPVKIIDSIKGRLR